MISLQFSRIACKISLVGAMVGIVYGSGAMGGWQASGSVRSRA
jgi:hypothetical protein